MIAQARHPGAGSGCQGCDPEIKDLPPSGTPAFLCALCIHWMKLNYEGEAPHISQFVARREALKEPEPVTT